MKRSLLALFGAAALLLTPAAYAQDGRQASDTSDDVHYEFEDDDLLAQAFGNQGDWVRVRPGPVRALLIRPRTQFVVEMLKSVEHL